MTHEGNRMSGDEAEYLSTALRAPGAALRRLRDAMSLLNSKGTPWAFMRLANELSEAEHDACQWFAELHARYLSAMGGRGVKPQSLEMGFSSHDPDPDSEIGAELSKKEQKIIREYQSAELAAIGAGRGLFREFCIVVCEHHDHDWHPNWAQKRAVVLCAKALVRHRAQGSRFRKGRR